MHGFRFGFLLFYLGMSLVGAIINMCEYSPIAAIRFIRVLTFVLTLIGVICLVTL